MSHKRAASAAALTGVLAVVASASKFPGDCSSVSVSQGANGHYIAEAQCKIIGSDAEKMGRKNKHKHKDKNRNNTHCSRLDLDHCYGVDSEGKLKAQDG